ncbi:holo-ACP synthase [soil metagenome]
MTVVGVGLDAIEIDRVAAALARTPGLLARLFTEGERAACISRCGDLKVGGLAARFAAKEAVAKALGTGVRGFAFRDVEVGNDELGKPVVTLHGPAADVAAELGVHAVHLSLSTSHDLALAYAVAESP